MINFADYLTESKEGKNVHLTHVNDLPILQGIEGAREAILLLRSIRDLLAGHVKSPVKITSKWDGAPAIICGINPENGKFFVGSKSVFAKNAKLNYTDKDIDANHEGGLAKKLKIALAYLPELGIKNVLQGDLLFTKGDIIHEKIGGEAVIAFKPNTIVYTVPEDSKLAHRMEAAQLGIVFHTSYSGKTLPTMKASFGANVAKLKPSKNVWYRDATFVDASGTATFTETEMKQLDLILNKELVDLFSKISPAVLNRIAENEVIRTQIVQFNNKKIRAGAEISDTGMHVAELIQYATNILNADIIAAKKQDTKYKRELAKKEVLGFYVDNRYQLKLIFDFYNLLIEAKTLIIRKLETVKEIGTFLRTGTGYKVTAPEGFVAVDHQGSAVKLVDQLQFSNANMNVPKTWAQ